MAIVNLRKPTFYQRTGGGVLKWKPKVLNLNLRNNLRKTEGGEGVIGNVRFYLREIKGGREGVWRCFPEEKTERT